MIWFEDPIKQKIVSQFISLLDSDSLLDGEMTEFDSVKFTHDRETLHLCINLEILDNEEYYGTDEEE